MENRLEKLLVLIGKMRPVDAEAWKIVHEECQFLRNEIKEIRDRLYELDLRP